MAPSVAILGAGPSGLLLARLLELKGIDYIVYERDTSAETAGAGGTLDIHAGSGQLALEKAGLFDKFKSLARYDGQAMKVVDSNMSIVADMKADGQVGRPEIDRKVLRQMLLDSVPAEKIKWEHAVKSTSLNEDHTTTIQFANGEIDKGFKLLVGADGAWSKARSLISSAKPRYSGIMQLQTTIHPTNPIYGKAVEQSGMGTFMALRNGKSIILQRLGTGSYMIYVTLRLPEHWAKDDAEEFHAPTFRRRVMDKEFSGWSTEVTDLVRHSDGEWRAWPLYALPIESLRRATVPGVALVGDAAHLGLPNGEGVNCAMFDSLQLAEEIGELGMGRLDEAVERYEAKMLPRGIEHIEDGHKMMEHVLHGDDSPKEFREWFAAAMEGA